VSVRVAAARRTDCQDIFGIARVGDADGVIIRSGRLDASGEAAIAGRGHDRNAAAHQAVALDANRCPAAGMRCDVMRHREAQVHSGDREAAGLLVDMADRLQCHDDGEFITLAGMVENPKIVETDGRADPVQASLWPMSPENPGHMRAVRIGRHVVGKLRLQAARDWRLVWQQHFHERQTAGPVDQTVDHAVAE